MKKLFMFTFRQRRVEALVNRLPYDESRFLTLSLKCFLWQKINVICWECLFQVSIDILRCIIFIFREFGTHRGRKYKRKKNTFYLLVQLVALVKNLILASHISRYSHLRSGNILFHHYNPQGICIRAMLSKDIQFFFAAQHLEVLDMLKLFLLK